MSKRQNWWLWEAMSVGVLSFVVLLIPSMVLWKYFILGALIELYAIVVSVRYSR